MAVAPTAVSTMQPSMTPSPSARARRSTASPAASPPSFISFRLTPRTPAAASRSTSASDCSDSSATTGTAQAACTRPMPAMSPLATGCSTRATP